jgi:hypothetical protein
MKHHNGVDLAVAVGVDLRRRSLTGCRLALGLDHVPHGYHNHVHNQALAHDQAPGRGLVSDKDLCLYREIHSSRLEVLGEVGRLHCIQVSLLPQLGVDVLVLVKEAVVDCEVELGARMGRIGHQPSKHH